MSLRQEGGREGFATELPDGGAEGGLPCISIALQPASWFTEKATAHGGPGEDSNKMMVLLVKRSTG